MASLTVTAFYTRRAVNIFIIFIIGFFVFRGAFFTAQKIWQYYSTPPTPSPTTGFGKLPQIVFPSQEELPEFSYKLETVTGGLTGFPESSTVYFMPHQGPGFLDLERAQEKASKMGFRDSPAAISDTTYRWKLDTEPPTHLKMDINTKNFYLRHFYEESPQLVTERNIPDESRAVTEVRTFLGTAGYLTEDLKDGSSEVIYYRYLAPNLIPAASVSEAEFVRVNLFRAPLDEMKILPPNPKNSLVTFLISGNREKGKRLAEVRYQYFPIDRETFGTYPLKPPNTAWQELQAGEGYVAHLGSNQGSTVTIRRVYLAFYDSEESQKFLQPIYVFEGDNDFMAYVSAVHSDWTE
jgi:hypothetical protein